MLMETDCTLSGTLPDSSEFFSAILVSGSVHRPCTPVAERCNERSDQCINMGRDATPPRGSPSRSQSRDARRRNGTSAKERGEGQVGVRASTAPLLKSPKKKRGAPRRDAGAVGIGFGNMDGTGILEAPTSGTFESGIVIDTDGTVLDAQAIERRGSVDTLGVISAITVSSTEDLRTFTMGKGISVMSGAKDSNVERALREGYSIAQAKAEEFKRLDTGATVQTAGNLTSIVQVKLAHRVYTAVSTLLYATLSMTKVSSLEKFIRNKSAMLPIALFDAEDWSTVLQVAKNYRLSVSYEVQKLVNAKGSNLSYQLAMTQDSNNNSSGDELTYVDVGADETVPGTSGSYHGSEIMAMRSDLEESQKSKQKLEEEISRVKTDNEHRLQKLTVSLDAAENRYTALEGVKNELENRLKDATSQLSTSNPHPVPVSPSPQPVSLTKDNEKLDVLVEDLKNQVRALEQSKEEEDARTAELQQKLEESMARASKEGSEKARLEEEYNDLRQKVKELEKSANNSASKLKMSATADQEVMNKLRDEVTEVKGHLSAAESHNKDLDERIAETYHRIGELEHSLEATKQELAVAESTAVALKEAAAAAAEAAESDAQAAASGEQSVESLQALVKQANLKAASVEAELKASEVKHAAVFEQMSKIAADLEIANGRDDAVMKKFEELKGVAKVKETELVERVDELKNSLASSQKDLQSEQKRHEEDSALLCAKVATLGESNAHLNAKMAQLEEGIRSQKESYDVEIARLKKTSADEEKSATAALSMNSESKVRDEIGVLKRHHEVKLKEFHSAWEKERDCLNCIIRDLESRDRNGEVPTKEVAAGAAADFEDNGRVNELHNELEMMKKEVKSANGAAEEMMKEYKNKTESLQKQVADLRSRLTKAMANTSSTSSKDDAVRDKELSSASLSTSPKRSVPSMQRYVGSVPIKAPSEKHCLPSEDSAGSRPIKGKLDAIHKIQAAMRGSIVREKLWSTANTIAANQSGILVAINGTHQGQTGWYMKVTDKNIPQYFYFCLDRGDFVMLCGPLDDASFEEALYQDRIRKKHDQIVVARSAIEGARRQLERLAYLFNVKEKEMYHLQKGMRAMENQIEHRENLMKKSYAKSIEKERTQTELQSRKCVKLQESLHDLEMENEKLLKRVKQKLTAIDEWAKFVSDTKEFLNTRQETRIVKAQSLIRSWLTRRRLKRTAVALAAKKKGVMEALGRTKQGKSGWYLNLGGEVYYYTNNRGTWSRMCGPLSEKQYSLAIRDCLKVTSKIKAIEDEALSKTSFDLPREVESQFSTKPHVYVGTKSEKLFIVCEAQEVVSRGRGDGTHRSRSRSSVSFDEAER